MSIEPRCFPWQKSLPLHEYFSHSRADVRLIFKSCDLILIKMGETIGSRRRKEKKIHRLSRISPEVSPQLPWGELHPRASRAFPFSATRISAAREGGIGARGVVQVLIGLLSSQCCQGKGGILDVSAHSTPVTDPVKSDMPRAYPTSN